MSALLNSLRSAVGSPWHALMRRAAKRYVAGANIGDAVALAEQLAAERSLPTTLGYWDGVGEHPDAVLRRYREAVEAIARTSLDTYLSIKFPSLDYCPRRLRRLLEVANSAGLPIHFDALAPSTVDRTREAIEELPADVNFVRFTLPGRWRRSLTDADWVVKRELPVRVVKGQFADVDEPANFDRRAGFLDIVDRVAGRAVHVSIATHDVGLLDTAVRRLQAAGTPCDVEVLYGLAWRRAVDTARGLGVAARIYVPYGAAYLPYCLAEARRSPRLMLQALADSIRG